MRYLLIFYMTVVLSSTCKSDTTDSTTNTNTTTIVNILADLVIFNGQILTVDENFSKEKAVAIHDGRFVFVGSNEEVQSYIGADTRVIDAGGKTVIPGLIESHVQALRAVRRDLQTGQPFEQLGSVEEMQNWLRRQVENTPAGEWIRLPRADITRIREGRFPTSKELNEVAPDHPAVFVWQFGDRQIHILNSAAMEAAGITRETPAPEGGHIQLNDAGEPTGRLVNSGVLTERFLRDHEYIYEEFLDGLERMLYRYTELGITSIFERSDYEDGLEFYKQLKIEGRLPLRVIVTQHLKDLDGSVQQTEAAIGEVNSQYGEGDGNLRTGPLHFRVDGGILYGTAYMREPYGEQAFELYDIEDPDYRGSALFSREDLENIIYAGHLMGWQMSAHVTGDAGVDLILDAIEASNARLAAVESSAVSTERRFQIIHGYFPNPEVATRVARLGVGVETQTAWYRMDGDALLEALGEERLRQFIGLQTWLNEGVRVAINADHMYGYDPDSSLNPWNPFITMYSAITRRTTGGLIIGPEQIVSRKKALRMMTGNAAWLSFDEDQKGSIETGKFADLAILSDDLMYCDEEAIKNIRSLLTVVNGEIVYDSGQLTSK